MIRNRRTGPQDLVHVGAPNFRNELEPLLDQATYPTSREEFSAAISEVVGTSADAHYVVAGSTAFVRNTHRALRGKGFRG